MALKLKKMETSSARRSALEGLNDRQKEAVETIEGPLLVIAGAGSGKTRVLTNRTAYLVEKGVKPWNILALTFTNKAAKEMTERIAQIVEPGAASQIWAGTFHSVFARILRYEAEKLDYGSSFSIYDTEDSRRIVKQAMNSMGIDTKTNTPQKLHSKISYAKNKMQDWRAYDRNAQSSADKIAAQVFKKYNETLKANNAMDFDDILINMILLLKNNPDILEKYREKFKYILVDEYQDTNRAQYIAVKYLSEPRGNICAVGDDAQSIYRWRGAEVRNILDFEKDFPKCKIVRLEQNYRSTQVILSAADSVIRHNKSQISKKMWTENVKGEKIKIFETEDEWKEAEQALSIIRENASKDFQYKDIAILYRTNAQSLAFENVLRRASIPYVIVGGQSFYKRKEVKDALAYLRLLLNGSDSEALLRIANEPPRGLGSISMQKIWLFAQSESIPLLEAMGRAEEIPELQKRSANSAKKFHDLIKKYAEQSDLNSPDLAYDFIQETGVIRMYEEMGSEEALDRVDNIHQLLDDISKYMSKDDEATLADYMRQISLVSEIDEKDLSDDKVTIMTLHSAKGLEFPIVILAGLEQGLFPFARADMNPDEREEERRLFYVGLTRAKEKAYITLAGKRMRFGTMQNQNPSPFLSEIDSKYVDSVSTGAAVRAVRKSYPAKSREYDQTPKTESFSQTLAADATYNVGDIVEHSKFGKGRITGLAGAGAQRQAMVYFQRLGAKKRLMLQYAKLKIISKAFD